MVMGESMMFQMMVLEDLTVLEEMIVLTMQLKF